MSIFVVSQNQKSAHSLKCFGQTVFNNFKDLVAYPDLKHNITEIMRVIKSPKSVIIFKMYKQKIIGYVLGEIMKLNDGRNVFYILYIYTSHHFRGRGIASELLETIQKIISDKSLDGILLTCDSEDAEIYNFYSKRGFMPDLVLRTYSKFEILFK